MRHYSWEELFILSLWHHLLFLFKHISPTPLVISNGIRQPSVNPRLFFQNLALRLKSPFEKRKVSGGCFSPAPNSSEGSCHFLFSLLCWKNLQHLPTPPAWIQHGLTLSYTPAHVRPVKGYCSTAFSRMRLTGWTHLHSPRANRSNGGAVLRDRPHLSTSFSNVIQNIAEGAGGEGDHTNILCLITHFKIPVSDVRPWRN